MLLCTCERSVAEAMRLLRTYLPVHFNPKSTFASEIKTISILVKVYEKLIMSGLLASISFCRLKCVYI